VNFRRVAIRSIATVGGVALLASIGALRRMPEVLAAVVAGGGGAIAAYWAADRLVDRLPRRIRERLRPIVFVGPALAIVGLYLVYPAVATVVLSLRDDAGEAWVGLANYGRLFTRAEYAVSLRNSVLWVVVVPVAVVALGLVVAVLVDRLPARIERIAKSLMFLPMAISFVGASVTWILVYSFRPEGFGNQIGVLNAIVVALGGEAQEWLALRPWNTAFLMVILVWLETGFAVVILSAAIKSVPGDLVEAARIDGAGTWQVFRLVMVPTIFNTIVVVWTTVVIATWNVFDIVWVMTGGRDGTSVIAQKMVDEFFTFRNDGIGAALAVVLFVAVLPVLIMNVRRFRAEEELR
jgi:alpha-glucoside transport system permease protein